MKYKKIMIGICMGIIVGTNSFVYANTTRSKHLVTQTQETPSTTDQQQEGLSELYHKAGLDKPEVIINTLLRLGITNEELKAQIGQGKKIYDIIQEKNITLDQFKKALSKEYSATIKQAIKDDKITKEEGAQLTKLLKERMSRWNTRKNK